MRAFVALLVLSLSACAAPDDPVTDVSLPEHAGYRDHGPPRCHPASTDPDVHEDKC